MNSICRKVEILVFESVRKRISYEYIFFNVSVYVPRARRTRCAGPLWWSWWVGCYPRHSRPRSASTASGPRRMGWAPATVISIYIWVRKLRYRTQVQFRQGRTDSTVNNGKKFRVSDPDWIRSQSGRQWIPDPHSESGSGTRRAKLTHISKKK